MPVRPLWIASSLSLLAMTGAQRENEELFLPSRSRAQRVRGRA